MMYHLKLLFPILLALAVLLTSCATARPLPNDLTEAERALLSDEENCGNGVVTLWVINENGNDVRLPELRQRIFLGLKTDSIWVNRYDLRTDIKIEQATGLQIGPPPRVPVQPVRCNTATLLVGSPISQSFFCGDDPGRCAWGRKVRR